MVFIISIIKENEVSGNTNDFHSVNIGSGDLVENVRRTPSINFLLAA